MIVDLETYVVEEFPPELREFLRMTLPNQGFFFLMEDLKRRCEVQLANLNTDCEDVMFKQKYKELLLERDMYMAFDRLARKLAEINNGDLT